jgi:hypothetical protein
MESFQKECLLIVPFQKRVFIDDAISNKDDIRKLITSSLIFDEI